MQLAADIIQTGLCRTRVGVHRPKPSLFIYPGLRAKPVWKAEKDSQLSNIASTLQSNHHIILQEYHNYRLVKTNDYNTDGDEHKLHNGEWSWNSYILKGKRISEFAMHCPQTVEILESWNQPRLMSDVPFSYTFFSTLGGQSSIAAHYGPCNLRLRCHFPLMVPSLSQPLPPLPTTSVDGGLSNRNEGKQQEQEPEIGMMVGGELVQWQVNEPVFFDDTYEHSGEQYIIQAYIIPIY